LSEAKEKSLVELSREHRRDMYLRIEVKVPERPASEEQKLYDSVRDPSAKWKFWK